jgi:Caspase domain
MNKALRTIVRGRGTLTLTISLLGVWLLASAQPTRDLMLERVSGGHRVALVIGNANYRGHTLANPLHDAEDIAAVLAKAGFSVSVGKDVSRQAMRDLVSKFVGALHDGDIALFYFSASSAESVGDGERQGAVSLRNRLNLRQVASNERCSSSPP